MSTFLRLSADLLRWSVLLALITSTAKAQTGSPDSIVYFYDFEQGQGLWQVSNGFWTVDTDTTLPAPVGRDGQMAGAIIRGNLPGNPFDTYLISPSIQMPLITPSEDLRVAFLHWHNVNGYATGSVHIRDDFGGGSYGPWEQISVTYLSVLNLDYWKNASISISKYAGRRVNIGFRMYGWCNSAGCGWGSPSGRGWRIDDVRVVKCRVSANDAPIAWDFDQDWSVVSDADKWWDPYSLFRIGIDTLVSSPSKPNVAGTNLNIPSIPATPYTTAIISPGVNLPLTGPSDELILRFRYYLNVNGYALAQVIAAVDSGEGRIGPWNTLAEYTTSTAWVRVLHIIPNSLKGKRVRFGFRIVAWCNSAGCGWGSPNGRGFYIDEVDVFATNWVPQVPQLVYPANGLSGLGPQPEFRWRLAAAAFSYRLQIAADSLFSTMVFDSSAIDPITLRLPSDLPATTSPYYWRVQGVNGVGLSEWSSVWRFFSGPVSVEEIAGVQPSKFTVAQNYPNPFNPETKINFQIPQTSDVTLKIYDLLGREVATLVNERMNPGTYSATWNAAGFASGVYLYRMQVHPDRVGAGSASTGSARTFVETRKLVLLR